MAITAKPVGYAVDVGAALCPEHLYMVDEGTGTTLTDKGSAATKVNLTMGAFGFGVPDWTTDATHGPILSFVGANSDCAGASSTLGLTTGGASTIVAIGRWPDPTNNPATATTVAGWCDSAAINRFYAWGFDTAGRLSDIVRDGATSYSNLTNGDVADNVYRMFAWAVTDTVGGVTHSRSTDGAAFDSNAEVDAALNITTTNLRFAIGGRTDSTPSNFGDFHLVAIMVYNRALSNSELTSLYNGGNVWTGMGLLTGPTVNQSSVADPLVEGTSEAITGSNFKPSVTNPTVVFGGASQTVTTATATTASFTCSIGNQLYGEEYELVLTNSVPLESSPITRTMLPPAGQTYWNITGTLAEAGQRLTALPDLQTGAQVHVISAVGGSVSSIEIFSDASFAIYDSLITAFTVRGNNADGQGWGASALQTVGGGKGWTIPDKDEGVTNLQSVMFQEDLDILVAGVRGVDCVLEGCAVSAQGTPNMTVSVGNGAIISNGFLQPVAGGNASIAAADSTNPRIDLVVASISGALAVRTGTPGTLPKPALRFANDVALAMVYVPAGDTAINSGQIIDKRMLRTQGPLVLNKISNAVTRNNTSAQQTYFAQLIPAGLFKADRVMRLRCGGTMLLNSGTPTVRLEVAYGGTTLFSDVSSVATADTDRLVWRFDGELIATSDSSQVLIGVLDAGTLGAKTAPTTGLGDAFETAGNNGAFRGTASVNSASADRLLTLMWTMNVANANNEIVMDYAVLTLE